MKKSRVVYGLGIHQLVMQVRSWSTYSTPMVYLIDAADSETESATFYTGAVHVVPDEED
jgi:hypothetical protein